MIIVKNRTLLIPREEYNIGTSYDNNSEVRTFRVGKLTEGGIDITNLLFSCDLEYANGGKDTLLLDTEYKEDEYIYLHMAVTKNMLQVPGTVLIQLRAMNTDGHVKWTSYKGALFVEDSINTPGTYTGDLTVLEQLEVKVSGVLTSEAERVEAEKQRESAEASREAAEGLRQNTFAANEASREAEFDAAIDKFNTDKASLTQMADETRENASLAENYMQSCAAYAGIMIPHFSVSFDNGQLIYEDQLDFVFLIDTANGNLNYTFTKGAA